MQPYVDRFFLLWCQDNVQNLIIFKTLDWYIPEHYSGNGYDGRVHNPPCRVHNDNGGNHWPIKSCSKEETLLKTILGKYHTPTVFQEANYELSNRKCNLHFYMQNCETLVSILFSGEILLPRCLYHFCHGYPYIYESILVSNSMNINNQMASDMKCQYKNKTVLINVMFTSELENKWCDSI